MFYTDISLTSLFMYRKVSNIRRTLVGNTIVVHSDVVGASPVGENKICGKFVNLFFVCKRNFDFIDIYASLPFGAKLGPNLRG